MDVIQTLGKYEIRGTLGKGAMGTVYDGWDPVIQRRVAIKTVTLPDNPDPETAEEIARFEREAQAAGRLSHPNIVAVFDYGETNDLAYIVMEFVDGPSLKAPLDAHERLTLANIQRVMDDLLAGLQFSHERGVVHRDIKPANIMMTSDGRAKIADFGIARIEMSNMTQAGTMLGTPAYMSPEQFRGEVVDARTDVYSAGVVLYQLLTGERPFEGGLTAIMHKVLNTEPPRPSELTTAAPAAMDAVVRRAMAKRPDDRFESAAVFAEAIRAAVSAPAAAPPAYEDDSEATMVGSTMARPAAPPPRAAAPPPRPATATRPPAPAAPAKAPARSRAPLFIGAGVAGVLVVGGLGGWLLLGSSHPPAAAPGAASTEPSTGQTAANTPAVAPPGAPGATQAETPPASTGTGTGPAVATPPAEPAQAAPGAPAATTATNGTTDVTQTAPPAAPAQVATLDPHILRQQLTEAVSQSSCTLASDTVQDTGAISVIGYAGGTAGNALRQQLAGIASASPIDWRVQQVDPVFCTALAALRPIAAIAGAPVSGLSVTLAGGQTVLHDGDRIMPRVTMADFPGELRVDYLGHDGSVVHLYPTAADPAQHISARPAVRLAAGAQLSIGEGGPGRPVWEVGPPYGTDMIIAVASSTPVLTQPPPQNAEDNAVAYLNNLANGIARVRAAGGQVAGSLVLVDTLAKH